MNLANFRYLRYRGPNGSYGNVSEIEFYRGGTKLNGAGYGSPGSWNNDGNTFVKAIDGNVDTFFDAPADTGYVGIDTGSGGSSQLTSIWQSTDVPQVADSGPDEPVELGVKFPPSCRKDNRRSFLQGLRQHWQTCWKSVDELGHAAGDSYL